MAERDDITIYIEGHAGHRGNALAHALVAKLELVLKALAKAERNFLDKDKRQTDYEVIGTGKVNPTHFTLRPVQRYANYDPIPAFNWTVDQLDRVKEGKQVDDRVDSGLALILADLAKKSRPDDYSKLWIKANGREIYLDEKFQANSLVIAAEKRAIERPTKWFEGVSVGSVVGDLNEVSDVEGNHSFVIVPPVGVPRIDCIFPEDQKEKMGEYLFQTVRVNGLVHYDQESPFPTLIEMQSIELVNDTEEPPHLLDLRGVFKGMARDGHVLSELLDGV